MTISGEGRNLTRNEIKIKQECNKQINSWDYKEMVEYEKNLSKVSRMR